MSAINRLKCDRCATEFAMLGDFAQDFDIRFVNYTRGSIGSTWIKGWDICPSCTKTLVRWLRDKDAKSMP